MLWVETARVRLLVLLLLLVPPLPALSALPSVDAMLAERSLGSPTAKVTIIEYSSLTCSHCADFHRETLPQIREQFIDKGLVRYVVRDFPLDSRATAAAIVAACVPPNHYFGFIDMLFRDQADWAKSPKPLEDLKGRAQLAGLAAADFDPCINNKALLDGIQVRAVEAQKRDTIESTPTFIINGRKLAGALPFADFKTAIDEALAKAK